MSTQWTVELPVEPTANIVIISNISPKTVPETIKDFFSFCGIIKGFEMKNKENEQTQVALVYFEQESAAKTALLLSLAEVDDYPIHVETYFKAAGVEEPIGSTLDTNKEINSVQDTKSVSHVMSELLASGYILTESVVAKGTAFDQKHGVSSRMGGYLSKVKTHLGNPTTATNSRTPSTTASKMQNLFNSKAGLKVQGIASKVSNVHQEAKRIAAEKKSASQALI